jgi:hypothetical protein
MTTALQIKSIETAFLEAFRKGIEALEEAGKHLCALLQAQPDARQRLIDEHGFDHGTLTTLEKIGNGSLHPRLAAFGTRYASLPMSEQKRLTAGTVPALVTRPDGTTDTIQVAVLRATPEMREQIINRDHIRTLDEQRAWMLAKARKPQTPATADPMPWHVSGKQVEVTRPVRLGRNDLLSMLRALEG